MIEGYIDRDLQARLTVRVEGTRKSVEIDAIIDTGFDGSLCLPIPVAIQLGLELSGSQVVELADGSLREELLFMGKAALGDRDEGKTVDISLTESEDALLGVDMLKEYKLNIDFRSKRVILE